jgi:hypothetical protein
VSEQGTTKDLTIRHWVRTAFSIVLGISCIWAFDASAMESFIASMCARLVLEIET